jgi:Flp pilus assembly protein TadG
MGVHTLRHEDGQAVVEFVLLFPLVLVMLMVVVEFGFALHTYVTINNAASEAARYAAVGNEPNVGAACQTAPGTPSIEGRAVDASGGLLDCGDVSVTYLKIVSTPGFARGDGVAVHVTHTYTMVTPLGQLMSTLSFGTLPSTLTMTACSDSRLELTPPDQSPLVAGSGCSS